MARSTRRLTPWLSVVALGALTSAAGIASAMTAPARMGATSGPQPTAPIAVPGPGAGCPAPAGVPTVTLSFIEPTPTITVPVGSPLVVEVPPWHWGEDSDVSAVQAGLLQERCSVVLSNRGRRAIFTAVAPGYTVIDAGVTPASNVFMPAWSAEVTVVPASAPPGPSLTTSIELPTTLVSGSTVTGTLVVTNNSVDTINLNAHGCHPHWGIGLSSPSIPFQPAFTTECSTAPFLLSPGANRLPFTVSVTYGACAYPGYASATTPLCLPGNRLPPLPPGQYQAVLASEATELHAAPVTVEVVASAP